MIFANIGMPEIAVILVVIAAIFFFGKNKMIDWAHAMGKAKSSFELGAKGEPKESKKSKKKK